MAYRRSIDADAENDDQNDDVQGHAFKSGRVHVRPDRTHDKSPNPDKSTESEDEDVEGHARRY